MAKVNVFGLVFGFFALAFLTVMVAAFMGDSQDAIVSTLVSSSVVNETETLSTSGSTLVNNYVVQVSSVYVYGGGGDNRTLATTEYSVANLNTQALATITLTNSSFNGNTSYVNYTYRDEFSSVAANTTINSQSGLQNYSSYFTPGGIVVGIVVIFAGLIIFLLFVKSLNK